MKVSVITVCFNSEKTIEDAIQSVISQTYKNIEHLIIDGNSTDSTLSILKKYPQLKIISEPDKGIYDAMNKGIRMCSGDVVAILNSDDVYNNISVIENVVKAFEDSDAEIVYGNLFYVKRDDPKQVVRFWKSSPYKESAFVTGWHPPHPTLFIKKVVYDKYGLFNINLNVSADFELMLRFIEKFKVKSLYLDKVFVRMRIGGISNNNIRNILTGNRNVKKAFLQNGIKYHFYYPFARLVPKLLQFVRK